MSYAGRLVQMSGNASPSVRPVVHEEAEQTPVEPQPVEPTRAPTTGVAAKDTPRREPARVQHADPREPAPTVIERIVTEPARERTHVVEKLVAASAPAPAPLATVERETTHREVVREWLTERGDGADPLESFNADNEMRDLLRAVRSWTSNAPAVRESVAEVVNAEIPAAERLPSTGAAPVAQVITPTPAPEPMQVSIGNVVITIEDAPTPAHSRRAAPSVDVESRLARHYWRER
jgi:hypothetical protein